jgi:NAD(P) transhydrogenase subunit alpha
MTALCVADATPAPRTAAMTATQIIQLYVFILAGFVGFLVITRVPHLLHTPLMAATNAISGISLVGSIVLAGGQYGKVATILGFIAVVCAMTNVVGGFIITDRMLGMFKRAESKPTDTTGAGGSA